VIEIKPFKPVRQDDQSGVDNQGFWFRERCNSLRNRVFPPTTKD